MMEVVVSTGTIRRAKLQSNRHRQQINIQFFKGPMPFLSPNQQCQITEGTRSSADADNGLDAFSGQSRSITMALFF